MSPDQTAAARRVSSRTRTPQRAESAPLRVVKARSTTARPTSQPRRPISGLERIGASDALKLTGLAAGFCGFGLVIVLAASSVVSIDDYGSAWALFERQVMWTVLGVIAFMFGQRVEVSTWRRFAVPFAALTAFLLLAVLAPGVGRTAGGSSRWIGAGPIRIQPSEFAKLAFVLVAADLAARREHARDQLRELVRPLGLILAVLAILILKQPDMGTAIVLVCIATSVLHMAGVRSKLLAGIVGILGIVGGALILAAPYRRERLFSFINPFSHASTSGYQVAQSLAALGSGHLVGTGLGGSATTWGLLPNAQTDFIFAVIGNEFGLIGAIAVIAAFVAFAVYGLRVAARTEDRFSAFLATGITCWIVSQALINIGGVVGVLPETGIPLPFLSFGGSSLVVVLCATGILVNIARRPKLVTDPARGKTRR